MLTAHVENYQEAVDRLTNTDRYEMDESGIWECKDNPEYVALIIQVDASGKLLIIYTTKTGLNY